MIAVTKTHALSQIRELMEAHELTVDEIDAYVRASTVQADGRAATIVRVLSYIGGTFIFAGIVTFVALQWESMNSAARVIVSLGSGVAMFVMALIALKDERYRVASVPLFVIAAMLQPTGMMIAFDEFGAGGDARVAGLITLGVFGFEYLYTTIKLRLVSLALLSLLMLSGFWGLLLDLFNADPAAVLLSFGAAWTCLAFAARATLYQPLSALLYFFGCWATLWGWWDVVESTAIEASFLLGACGFVYLGVWAKSRVLNFSATVAILAYTAYFTGTYFADSIGWPIALILIGAMMIGIGSVAVRIDRRYLRP